VTGLAKKSRPLVTTVRFRKVVFGIYEDTLLMDKIT